MKHYSKSVRLLSIFLVLSALIGVMPNSTAEATVEKEGFFVSSPLVPEEVVEYAQYDFSNHLSAMIESNDFEGNPNYVELGTPFTYLGDEEAINQYYFPVMYNGSIIYVYRVYEDTVYYEKTGVLRYVSSMSAVLAEKIMELAEKTTADSPAVFIVDNNYIVAIIDSEVEIVAEDLAGRGALNTKMKATDYNAIVASVQNLTLVNATEEIQYERSMTPARATSKYITMSITETQGNNCWCAAYVTAAIIRTVKGGSLTASTIANHYGASTTTGISHGQCKLYAEVYYDMAPLIYDTALSNQNTKFDIDNNWPIYAGMRHSATVAHAVAIRGYNASTYSVWNPWYTSYETFSISTLTYIPSTDTRAYYWYATIYNWQ